MFFEYNKKTNLRINYQSIGSGGGIQQLTNKTVDFGASDAPLNDEQAKRIGVPALHIPVTAGAVVVSYNLPGVHNPLKFTGEVLAEIFLGNITKWNDAKIVALNKGVNLPAMAISVLHRAEGSGTTAANVKMPADSKVFLTNTDAKDGYPIASFSWAIIYKEQNYNSRSAATAKQMLTLLWWMATFFSFMLLK